MKKILILILALLSVFTFAACDGGEVTDTQFDEFKLAYNATVPVKIKVDVLFETTLGDLNSSFETTFNPNGSSKIVYSYDVFNEISSDGEIKSTVSGEIECDKDGNYSDGGEFVGKNSVVSGVKLNLDASLIKSYSIEGDVLTATVAKENVKAVTGVDFGADTVLMITKADGKIISVSASYTAPTGNVSLICYYTN